MKQPIQAPIDQSLNAEPRKTISSSQDAMSIDEVRQKSSNFSEPLRSELLTASFKVMQLIKQPC